MGVPRAAATTITVPPRGNDRRRHLRAGYIPYVGAFVAGAFAVLLALSSQGTTTALIMLVVVVLANEMLQDIVQPIAFGSTLELSPLVVLIVSIDFEAIFSMVGLVLAAPLTSAAVHTSREFSAAKAADRSVPHRPTPRRTREAL